MDKYIITIFILISPLLDLLAFYNIPVNIIVRGLFILYCLYKLVKIRNIKVLLPIIVFILILTIYQYINLNLEIKDIISSNLKLIFIPVTLLYLSAHEIKDKEKLLLTVFISYIGIYLLSYILKFGSEAYLLEDGKQGFKGVFSSINEFSAIIISLIFVVTKYLKENKKYIILGILLLLTLMTSLLIGTKIMFGGLVLNIIYLIYLEKEKIKNMTRNSKIVLTFISVLVIMLGLIIFLNSRIYKNIEIQNDYFKVDKVISVNYLNKIIFNNRLTFTKENFNYFNKQPIDNKLFGISMNNYDIKMIEIDIFDVIIRYGILGFVFFTGTVIVLFKNIKLDNQEKLSLIVLTLISLTSGHVILYPNVAIYYGIHTIKKMR